MSNEFEVVKDRPKNSAGSRDSNKSAVVDAVLATATAGGSVRIAINGSDSRTLRARFQNNDRLRAVGSIRTRVADGYVYVWLEPKA